MHNSRNLTETRFSSLAGSLCLHTIFEGISFGGNKFADNEKNPQKSQNLYPTKTAAPNRSQLKKLNMVIIGVKIVAENSSILDDNDLHAYTI